MNKHFIRLAPVMALGLPLPAAAQQGADAADPKASAPALRYRSAFADYKRWQAVKPGNWRQLNDNVAPPPGKAGGQAGDGPSAPAASAPADKAPAPAAPTHPGHPMHEGKQ